MKPHEKTPRTISDDQKDGRKYIVFDKNYDPVEWVVAHYEKSTDPEGNPLGCVIKGLWITNTSDPTVINPTHYVNLEDDVV
jgi:hypothetical protein